MIVKLLPSAHPCKREESSEGWGDKGKTRKYTKYGATRKGDETAFPGCATPNAPRWRRHETVREAGTRVPGKAASSPGDRLQVVSRPTRQVVPPWATSPVRHNVHVGGQAELRFPQNPIWLGARFRREWEAWEALSTVSAVALPMRSPRHRVRCSPEPFSAEPSLLTGGAVPLPSTGAGSTRSGAPALPPPQGASVPIVRPHVVAVAPFV